MSSKERLSISKNSLDIKFSTASENFVNNYEFGSKKSTQLKQLSSITKKLTHNRPQSVASRLQS
jgi:hypothetical protein